MAAPVVVKPISAQVVNERAAYGPFNLRDYIQVAEGSQAARFHAELKDGKSLPAGMICTADGILTGIPAKETSGVYEVVITAENDDGSIQTTLVLTIKPGMTTKDTGYIDELKAQVWEAMDLKLPIPDLEELNNRPITKADIYYLLERWAMLKIWDAYNLEPPGALRPLTLEGASPRYQVYDCGSCLVTVPKKLFSHEHTLEDGLQTARAMAREVYRRQWAVELVGFEKLTRAAWVEVQHLGDKAGKRLEVINFSPSLEDVRLYNTEALHLR